MTASLAAWGTWALDFVRNNQVWAGPICFVLAFAESLAFVSLIVPSSVLLIGVGTLVPLSGLSFAEIWVATALGAAAGDWLSYWLGMRFKDRIGEVWPFSRNPGMLPRARQFIERWGAVGVFGGRFLGPLRATIPLIAGVCAMSWPRFQIANVVSAVVWAFVLLAPGALGMTWFKGYFG